MIEQEHGSVAMGDSRETEQALRPVPYDHSITLQAAKVSSGNVDGADPRTVLLAVLGCTETWVADARIIGNVRAIDIAIAIRAALAAPQPTHGTSATDPAPSVISRGSAE